jgi:diphosphomevalonate decarboxylase
MAQALALAYYSALGEEIDPYTLSKRARRISGSGCRLHSGWNLWNKGTNDEDSFAIQLYDEKYWPEVRVIIAVSEPGIKKISSRIGMQTTVNTCPKKIYEAFVEAANLHIADAKEALRNKDIRALGETYRKEYEFFRLVRLETKPPIEYETPTTYKILSLLEELRDDGIPVYGGTQAGPNVNILTLQNHLNSIEEKLKNIEGIKYLLKCRPGEGVKLTNNHLF